MTASWLRIGLPVLMIKAHLLLLVFLSPQLLTPSLFQKNAYDANFVWPRGERVSTISRFKTWDGQHYLYLSEQGYKDESYRLGMASNAFYPLWPLAIKLGSFALAGNSLLSALVLANLFSLLAFVFLHALLRRSVGDPTADTSTLLLLSYPGSMFLVFPYTESLFLLLSVLFFYFMQRDRLIGVAIVAFLLPLTRAVGVFITLPLAYELFRRFRSSTEPRSARHWGRDLLLLSLPALGWATYFLILYLSTGDAFIGFKAQDQFTAKRSIASIVDVGLLFRNLLDVGSIHGFLDSFIDRFWFLLLLACLYPIWKLNRAYFCFCLATGVLPALTGSFLSYTRFFLIVFPFFVVAGRLLSRESLKGLRWAILGIFFSVQVVFLIRHSHNFWVG